MGRSSGLKQTLWFVREDSRPDLSNDAAPDLDDDAAPAVDNAPLVEDSAESRTGNRST